MPVKPPAPPASVLVLGIVPSLTWLVARCLRRAGHAPDILCWHALSPMRLSGDCRHYLSWSRIHKTGGTLDVCALDQVRSVCRRHATGSVLGADFDTALLLARARGDAAIPACATPSAATITTFNNKWNLARLLEQLGLPYPESEYADSAAALLGTALPFPIISKPLDKWASVGFEIHASRAQLAATVAAGRLKATYPLIVQRFIPGWDVGASFLARDGKLAAYSVFRHLRRGEREFYDDARVRQYLEVFVAATNYNGVGHIDARYDPASRAYRILELNPRFWASLLYAANAGLNYPDLLLQLAQWDGKTVQRARQSAVRLPAYERAMGLGNRWFSIGYEKLTRAKL
ncbi:MAG: ATP-grasp domain-containing protein [Pseudomonadota bacterium]